MSGLSAAEVQRTFDAFLLDRSPAAKSDVGGILESLAVESQDRPTFAAFAIDLEDVFGDTPAEDPPDWPDRLRDILGLQHYDPVQWGEQPIAVFQYPIKRLRRAKGRTGNLVGMPTVLDGSFNPAFCPPPRGQEHGFAVDLSGGVEPVREVVHPTPRYLPEDLIRTGTIRAAPGVLKDARAFHLTALREKCGRPDYAAATDFDIL
jgi:hypothetical protein